jgi:outer membrane protein
VHLLVALAAVAAAPPPAEAQAPAVPPPGQTSVVRVLSLGEALATARRLQPQLRQARAGAAAAGARADEARAALLPSLAAAASYARQTANPRATSPAYSWKTGDSWSLSATASLLVWDFGRSWGTWRAASAGAAAQLESERAARLQVDLQVRTSYFAARAARDLVAVARETLANQEAHLRQIEGFVRAGTRPEIDLAQARTDRANALVQLINAENGDAAARAQLALAVGLDGPADFEVGDETPGAVRGEELATDEILPEAAASRADLAALEAQVRAQELALGAARAASWPSLAVSTGISDRTPALADAGWNWNATATLTWTAPLFLAPAQVDEAGANLEALRAQAAALRLQVRLDVEQARLAVRAARGALEAAQLALASARDRLRLAEGRYQTGVGSAIELGDSQLALTAAAAQRVQARYALASSRAQLLRALGREGGE